MNVVRFFTKVRFFGDCGPCFDPLSFNSHLFLVLNNHTLSDNIAQFLQFFCDFRRTIVLTGSIGDIPDLFLDFYLALSVRICFPFWKRMIFGMRDA